MFNLLKIAETSPLARNLINCVIIIGSVLLCVLLLPLRFPGLELLGITPHWLLIWVVAWSIKRTAMEGAIAGIILGLIQDSLTAFEPSHTISLALVGIIIGSWQKDKYIKEDFITIALVVFVMSIIAETIMAIQFILPEEGVKLTMIELGEVWLKYQKITLASAIISSLWSPVIYYPLNIWWTQVKILENK
jgi:rod shape-determining protein MreD